MRFIILVFFFQAEDGIRDRNVTGVQTCALPIYAQHKGASLRGRSPRGLVSFTRGTDRANVWTTVGPAERTRIRASWAGIRRAGRSEERRVGKEWRGGWGGDE